VTDGFRGGILVFQGVSDIRIKWVIWILDDLVLHLLAVIGFPAARRGANWVRLSVGRLNLLSQGVNVIKLQHPVGVFMMKLVLSKIKALSGGDHIAIKGWGVVVEGLLSWVKWWLLEDEIPVMTNNLLSDWKVLIVLNNILIFFTPVGNCVVLVVTCILLWVLVLTASGRGANWIRLNIKLKVLGKVNATNELTGSWIISFLSIMIKSIELVERGRLL